MKGNVRGTAMLGVAISMLGGLVAGPGSARAWAAPPFCPQTWKLSEVSEQAGDDGLSDVVATGRSSAWAVGDTGETGRTRPLVRRWDGSSWKDVSTPDLPNTALSNVDASSDQNVWAFGPEFTEAGSSLKALRWNGAAWSTSDVDSDVALHDVDVVGDDDVWIAGTGLAGDVPLRHWNGRAWAGVSAPGQVWALHMTSGTQGWGVGTNGGGASVLRWNGTSWKSVSIPGYTVPDDGQVGLTSVLELSPTNVWAVGTMTWPVENREELAPVALRWDGTRWTRLRVPGTGFGLGGLAPDGCGGVWMQTYDQQGLLHHRAGKWTRTSFPMVPETDGGLGQMVNVPGTAKMLGVGVVSRWDAPPDGRLDAVLYEAGTGYR